MPKRIEIGTDIATIGVWDPTCERHDLGTARFADYVAGLQSEAHESRLFFVETGADGSFLTDIYVDVKPDPALLTLYSAVEREFLISSKSGRLIAGGIEDFTSASKQITSDEDQFEVPPGLYALRFYELIEDKHIDHLRNHIGVEDYAYYEGKFAGTPWGCLLFIIVVGFLIAKLWLISASLFAVWLGYLVFQSRRRTADQRLQDIAKRIEAFDDQFPPFIYVLRRVTEVSDIKGGWHKLD